MSCERQAGGRIDRSGMMKPKNEGVGNSAGEKWDESVSLFQSFISTRSDSPRPLSIVPAPLLRSRVLYLVAKCIKSNPATLSQLRSFSLEICPSANGAPDSVGEELRHCWAALG